LVLGESRQVPLKTIEGLQAIRFNLKNVGGPIAPHGNPRLGVLPAQVVVRTLVLKAEEQLEHVCLRRVD